MKKKEQLTSACLVLMYFLYHTIPHAQSADKLGQCKSTLTPKILSFCASRCNALNYIQESVMKLIENKFLLQLRREQNGKIFYNRRNAAMFTSPLLTGNLSNVFSSISDKTLYRRSKLYRMQTLQCSWRTKMAIYISRSQ